jgi:hypothetical protein
MAENDPKLNWMAAIDPKRPVWQRQLARSPSIRACSLRPFDQRKIRCGNKAR